MKKRILVVDDEASFTRLLKLNLEQTDDYEVQVENGAERALAAARTFRPDLILLDMVMPGMVGSEVATQLCRDRSVQRTPVVFLSAVFGRKSPADSGGNSGEYPFIAKPASLDEIVAGIQKHLGTRPLAGQPGASPA